MRAGEARSSWGAATMQQVSDWLEKLGLGQYAPRFAENDISFAVNWCERKPNSPAARKIPPKAAIAAPRDTADLTDQDLKEIGVSLVSVISTVTGNHLPSGLCEGTAMAETPKLAASLAASFCSAALRNHFKAAAGGLPFPRLRAFPVETGGLLASFFFSGTL